HLNHNSPSTFIAIKFIVYKKFLTPIPSVVAEAKELYLLVHEIFRAPMGIEFYDPRFSDGYFRILTTISCKKAYIHFLLFSLEMHRGAPSSEGKDPPEDNGGCSR
ncbi:hypothetical protein CEXT_121381, partial [Caerostris extrusa]